VRHYVLTRSAYGPEWDIEANRRRLDITRAVTARLMAAQSVRDWTWIVALHPGDPLLEERVALFTAAAPTFVPMFWQPPAQMDRVDWDPEPQRRVSTPELVAASAYKAPWRALMPFDEPFLQTRLDDDDGLARDALQRYQRASSKGHQRMILMLPRGLRVYGSRFAVVTHNKNAMHTLVTPKGDGLCVYDYGHTKCFRVGPVRAVDARLGWVWTRHRDTLSGWRNTDHHLSNSIRRLFDIDWAVIAAAEAA